MRNILYKNTLVDAMTNWIENCFNPSIYYQEVQDTQYLEASTQKINLEMSDEIPSE